MRSKAAWHPPDNTLGADYALSSKHIIPHLEARLASEGFAGRNWHIIPAILRAEPRPMRRMLNAINADLGPVATPCLPAALPRACETTCSRAEVVTPSDHPTPPSL